DDLLHRLGADLRRGALQARVHDLHAGVAQRLRHDLGAAVVTVEPGLGDEDLHAGSNAGSQRGCPLESSATRRGARRTRWPIFSAVGSAPITGAKMRWPATLTMANTRGPSKPTGSPVSCRVKAWIAPSRGRSTHSNASDAQSPQNPRGGHAALPHELHRVVTRRPSARRAYNSG